MSVLDMGELTVQVTKGEDTTLFSTCEISVLSLQDSVIKETAQSFIEALGLERPSYNNCDFLILSKVVRGGIPFTSAWKARTRAGQIIRFKKV